MTLLTQPPENVKISFMHRISDAPIHFPSFKVATGNHSDFGVATSKTPCLQELSAIGSHSSHVTTGILFIWEKFKIVLPDSYLFPIYVHVWLQNSGYCGYRGYLHDSFYRWFTIVINVYADMREGLLRDFLFQAHADPESVDKSLSVVLPAQVIHGVNDCVYTLYRKTMQQAVQVLVVLPDSLTVSARRFTVHPEQRIQNRISFFGM